MSRLFGPIRQVAYVVPDLDEAMRYWAGTLGVGPFFVFRRVAVEDHVYRGMTGPAPLGSIALANSGDLQIELIQVHDHLPSVWREFGDLVRGGFHHVSAWTTRADFETRRARLLAAGVQIIQEGRIAASGVRFAYFATNDGAGRVIYEIADVLEPPVNGLVQMIADSARDWDGRDPVRELPLERLSAARWLADERAPLGRAPQLYSAGSPVWSD